MSVRESQGRIRPVPNEQGVLLTKYLTDGEVRKWQKVAALWKEVSDKLDEIHMTVVQDLQCVGGRALQEIQRAIEVTDGNAYMFTPQPEWMGGKGGEAKYLEPHVCNAPELKDVLREKPAPTLQWVQANNPLFLTASTPIGSFFIHKRRRTWGFNSRARPEFTSIRRTSIEVCKNEAEQLWQETVSKCYE